MSGTVESMIFDDVPDEYLVALGDYVTVFSHVEERLENLLYALIGDRDTAKTVSASRMYLRDKIKVVSGLILMKAPSAYDIYAKFEKRILDENSKRNWIVHGRWFRFHDDETGREHLLRASAEVTSTNLILSDSGDPIRRQTFDLPKLRERSRNVRSLHFQLDELIRQVAADTGFGDATFTFRQGIDT